MKVLLSDGSGLTSRQTAGCLHAMGHTVGVVSSDSFGLSRFTRSVSHWHRVPPFGRDPRGWLDAVTPIVRQDHYDVLLPTQEQVAVLSWASGTSRIDGVSTVVPTFDALRAVQDKVACHATMARLAIAQPDAAVLTSAAQLRAWDRFPAYAKTPIGTASAGVRRIEDRREAGALSAEWEDSGIFSLAGAVLVQVAVPGPLVMVQAVFDRGRMVASHTNLRLREGARGGASHKRSVLVPAARDAIDRLGCALEWHGALAADAIVTADGCRIIDVNPRLVEPGNAWRAGVDLVGPMLGLAVGDAPRAQPPGFEGVETHQLLLAVLRAAGDGRRAIVRELIHAATRTGDYAHSREELTPTAHDWRAVTPVAIAAVAALARPSTWRWFANGSVERYSISPAAWRELSNDADLRRYGDGLALECG